MANVGLVWDRGSNIPIKYVYTPSGSPEAHLIVHALKEESIEARIHGEALTGAIGELPAESPIKIAVADEDYERARELVLEWEKRNHAHTPQHTLEKSNYAFWYGLAIGAVCSAIACFVILAKPLGNKSAYLTEFDYNNDGKIDFVYHYDNIGGVYANKTEWDRNFDGKFDVITTYDDEGNIISDVSDEDFNGIYDTKGTYKYNMRDIFEQDINEDGKADQISTYDAQQLQTITYYELTTHKPVKIEYFNHERLVSADYDSDRDGFMETRYTYDDYAEIRKTEIKEKTD